MLGIIGAGKTHLARKLTGDETLKMGQTASSVTQSLFKRQIHAGTKHKDDFFILDGPL